MTLNDYREQFHRNIIIVSQAANSAPDLSESTVQTDPMAAGQNEAVRRALKNTDRALEYLYNNRRRNFKSATELEELLLEIGEIIDDDVVSKDSIFGFIKEILGLNYASIEDIPILWDRYVSDFYWMLSSNSFEVEEIAAFSEYVINTASRFFSVNCTVLAMLMSACVFMRFDLPLPEYTSGDDYYRVAMRDKIPSVSDLYQLPADPEFWNFVSYYLGICVNREPDLDSFVEKTDDGTYICRLTGHLTGENSRIFRQNIEDFYAKNSDAFVVFDCSMLAWIDMEGISVLAELREGGKRFMLKDSKPDCLVLFKVEGFQEYLEEDDKLPQIDLSNCAKINEGAEGIIYRVSDEVVAKTFKFEPDYYDIVKRRIAQKNALIAGVPAPFSFGYAEYEGKIVTLMELINAKTLLQIISAREDIDEYISRYAQFVRQLHEIREEEKLKNFDRNLLGEEILGKCDRCDLVLREEYRGRARRIIEAVVEPECLVHGDLHPNNVMINGDEMLFIDFDSFSTGKAIYDLGTIYRAHLCNENRGVSDYNGFLKLPFDKCQRIWDKFIAEYYKGEPDYIVKRKAAEARLIGTVLALARLIKIDASPELISRWAAELERAIDGM